ncbi:glycosyltransferase family 2 protein [Streptomyces olivaceoviridis]|uniref:glycosyltransferase family 2 protein n=1 Tax=Streptomyces olivaceoviridis TaxID=1921 RepID=UPI0036FFB4ED
MTIFPRRTLTDPAWVVGAAVTHLDNSSRSVNAPCWTSSKQLNENAFAVFRQNTALTDSETHKLQDRATEDPAAAFEEMMGRLTSSPTTNDEICSAAEEIKQKTRLIFYRSNMVDSCDTGALRTSNNPINVVIPYRATPDNPLRKRNIAAITASLAEQTLPRDHYQVTVVEESEIPTVPNDPEIKTDNYVHVKYSGPFNRALAMNCGISDASDDTILCLMDGDIFPDADFVRRNASRVAAAPDRMHVPYSDMFCLLQEDSRSIATDGYQTDKAYNGYLITHPVGGCTWLTRTAFDAIGGFDENFKGWGGEDRDFATRAEAMAPLVRHPELLPHLFHERPYMRSSRREIMEAAGKEFHEPE